MKNLNLVIGCMHTPYHNKALWRGLLKLIRDHSSQLQSINLIGDILDLNSLSNHERGQFPIIIDGEEITINKEYKMIKVFDEIDSVVKKNVKKRYVWGNHEARYLRQASLPDNKKIIAESPEEYFRLRERGYEVKTQWKEDYFLLGDHLQAFHGELLGVNPAKRQLDKLKHSCIFAHSHRAGTHHDGAMVAYNIGWLGDRYSPVFNYAGRLTKRNWVDGFGLVTIDDNGDFYANPITCHNNTFYYAGVKYGG